MSTPKRHHYLPRFYLNNFTRDGILWVFDRERNEYRRQTPINTAVRSHYYSVEDNDGIMQTDIEAILSHIEGDAKQLIEKLIVRDAITRKQKEKLSYFVALMTYRVPKFENNVNAIKKYLAQRLIDMIFYNKKRTQDIMNQLEQDKGEKSNVSAKELCEFYKSGEYDIDIHRNESIGLMLKYSNYLARYLRQMNWLILHAPSNTSFITTDNPVTLIPPQDYDTGLYSISIIAKGVKILLPLSYTTCLAIYDLGKHIKHLNVESDGVKNVNLNVADHSDRIIIGQDKELVRELVKTTRIMERKNNNNLSIY